MMKRVIFSFLVLLAIIPAFLIKTSADTRRIYDEDGFITGDVTSLEDKLAETERLCGVAVRVYLYDTDSSGFYTYTELLARFGLSTRDDVILLVITEEYSSYYYELITYGRGYSLISDSAAERILDDSGVYSIKRKDFENGIAAFSSAVSQEIMSARRRADTARVVIPIVIALIAGGVTVGIVVYRYKRKLKSPIYPLSNYARLDLHVSRDDFVTSHISRVRVNTSSGGGGGGSRGGSRGKR